MHVKWDDLYDERLYPILEAAQRERVTVGFVV
jgi:hypothetical protein